MQYDSRLTFVVDASLRLSLLADISVRVSFEMKRQIFSDGLSHCG